MDITPIDEERLERCVELAEEALFAGDDPFGSVLTDGAGVVLAEARNREQSDRDPTAHPELELARWAIAHLSPDERAGATVYTSGEHCAMCAGAHAWAGLGRIVAAATSGQLAAWRASWGLADGPVLPLAVNDVAPGIPVLAPVAPFDERMRVIHERAARRPR